MLRQRGVQYQIRWRNKMCSSCSHLWNGMSLCNRATSWRSIMPSGLESHIRGSAEPWMLKIEEQSIRLLHHFDTSSKIFTMESDLANSWCVLSEEFSCGWNAHILSLWCRPCTPSRNGHGNSCIQCGCSLIFSLSVPCIRDSYWTDPDDRTTTPQSSKLRTFYPDATFNCIWNTFHLHNLHIWLDFYSNKAFW
jgi:hypothetical protein